MLLYGNSGHARVVIDCLESSNIKVTGIFDDNYLKEGLNRYTMLGEYDKTIYPDEKIIITIGDNLLRKKISKTIKHKFGKAVHSTATISHNVLFGLDSVAIHKSILQSNVYIGNHVIINTAASVDHDCIVDDYVHVSPNATLCGGVTVGEGTHVGAAAVIIPNIKVGKWVTIGAGTVVIKDVPDYCLVVGNPARIVRTYNKADFE